MTPENKRLIITIDGPSGAGKSTVSKLLAERLEYEYIDTGALYRAVAVESQEQGVDIDNDDDLIKLCSGIAIFFKKKRGALGVFVNGREVTKKIRDPEVSLLASRLSAKRVVRDALFHIQRRLGSNGGAVFEGRDMGTIVFPEADIKFFLDANHKKRAIRRHRELKLKGHNITIEQVQNEIDNRDLNDSSRELSPLKPSDDAIIVDSTELEIEHVVGSMLESIKRKFDIVFTRNNL